MKETKNVVTHSGAPLTLLGQPTVIGEVAPNFTATDQNAKSVQLSDFKGKTVVVSVFPSIDTPVCAAQTRQFNKRATEMGENVVVLSISKDLPFALHRFCAAEGIDRVIPLSDYKTGEFGVEYGFLIKELMLLARGVIIIDPKGYVRYVEYVNDVTKEPNYEAVIKNLEVL